MEQDDWDEYLFGSDHQVPVAVPANEVLVLKTTAIPIKVDLTVSSLSDLDTDTIALEIEFDKESDKESKEEIYIVKKKGEYINWCNT